MRVKKIGLLVMAYGTPRKPEDIEPYYTHIRHGRKPPEHLLEDLKQRYDAIGGVSPLAKITEEQKAKLESRLNEKFKRENVQFYAYLGLKHIEPFIEDAVQKMKEDGIKEAISLVLAPHYSTFSVKTYNERAKKEAERINGPVIHTIDSWYDEPKFIQYWAGAIQKTMAEIPSEEKEKTVVIFSAHSLPEKILSAGDPYPQQLEATAEKIAREAGIPHYAIGWQSAGNTPEPWIGPDVQDLTRDLFEQEGFTSFIYCPVGFVADHLEVLYDNDYECKAVTDELGASYYRPEMPNARADFIDCLATVVEKKFVDAFGGNRK